MKKTIALLLTLLLCIGLLTACGTATPESSNTRTMVQYIVTEYGVANLKYKSARERAQALIAIAHPDFREELTRQMPL